MSKIEQAVQIVKDNPSLSRPELIQKFMTELGMTKAGATTYSYNATKLAGGPKKPPNTRAVSVAALGAALAAAPRTRSGSFYDSEDARRMRDEVEVDGMMLDRDMSIVPKFLTRDRARRDLGLSC